MRLRENYRDITYNIGDFVTILPNLVLQENLNRLNGGTRLRAGIGNNRMLDVQGMIVRIRGILENGTYTIDRDLENLYSTDMFLESYIESEETDETNITNIIYNGMYLFSTQSDSSGTNQELFKVQTSPEDIQEGIIRGHYILRGDKDRRSSDISITIDMFVDNPLTWMRYGRIFRATFLVRMIEDRQYISSTLYIPDNDILMERFGVTNRVIETKTKKIEGHLDLPNIFEGYKYPVVMLSYTNDGYYGIQKEYGFKISDKILVTYDGKTKVSKKINNILGTSKVANNEKHLKEIILNWSKATVKSYEKSVELFGHKTRKKAMFDAIDDKGKKKVFKITSVKFNYDKEGTFYHIVELNDGTLNLKFLLDDINLVLPTINNYVAPKDRTIKAQDECKLVNNKITPVQKGSTVKVVKLFNRHQVHNPRLGVYDKNTIALVVDKNSNKQFECKIKQLKKI